VGQAAGVLEQMVEGQEQLRAELGLVAERLDALERGAKAVVVERPAEPSRLPLWGAIAAIVLAAVALAVALVGTLSP
jgi:hypothetical protein